LNWIWAFICL